MAKQINRPGKQVGLPAIELELPGGSACGNATIGQKQKVIWAQATIHQTKPPITALRYQPLVPYTRGHCAETVDDGIRLLTRASVAQLDVSVGRQFQKDSASCGGAVVRIARRL